MTAWIASLCACGSNGAGAAGTQDAAANPDAAAGPDADAASGADATATDAHADAGAIADAASDAAADSVAAADAAAAHQANARADYAVEAMLLAFWNQAPQYLLATKGTTTVTGYWTFAQALDAVIDAAERQPARAGSWGPPDLLRRPEQHRLVAPVLR